MAKIAVELERALSLRVAGGGPGTQSARILAEGDGWSVTDVICTSGPSDRRFEERHSEARIALIAAGSFEYRSTGGRALMTPGSLLLGSAGQNFECAHEHGAGDRCVAFGYAPEYFEWLAADAGINNANGRFGTVRLPALQALAPVAGRACSGLAYSGFTDFSWEELSLQLATLALRLASGAAPNRSDPPASAVARVTRAIRAIEAGSEDGLSLGVLARKAGLSPYHFLRTFERLTGVTPHQYILRSRLREAAMRLAAEPAKVTDIAFDCGFGDVSNFNRAFRGEFGVSPRAFRANAKPCTNSSKGPSSEPGASALRTAAQPQD